MMDITPFAQLNIQLGGTVMIGDISAGRRRISEIIGGEMTGAGLNGTVLPGGSDWQLLRSDDTAQIDARLVIRTSDGACVAVRSQGYRHGPAQVLDLMNAGKEVDPALYYFWLTLTFETASPSLCWLTKTLCVARAHKIGQVVHHSVYAIGDKEFAYGSLIQPTGD